MFAYACRKINLAISSLNFLEYPRYSNILNLLGITCWYWLLEYSRITNHDFNSKMKVLPSCQLGISFIFIDIQVANTSKLFPENPTNHADSRNSRNIQDAHKTLGLSCKFSNIHGFIFLVFIFWPKLAKGKRGWNFVLKLKPLEYFSHILEECHTS